MTLSPAEARDVLRNVGLCGENLAGNQICIQALGHDGGTHEQPWYFDRLCADRLADEVDVLVRNKVIDARSPAADALLDYRNPPQSPRSDRMAHLETRNAELRQTLARISMENPFPDELRNWHDQRAKLIAEVGTLKARVVELEAQQDSALKWRIDAAANLVRMRSVCDAAISRLEAEDHTDCLDVVLNGGEGDPCHACERCTFADAVKEYLANPGERGG